MERMNGAVLIGQSGGPTAVINASALGCIEAALACPDINKVYGAAHGIVGVLNDRIYDLTQEDPDELQLMRHTPSSVFGACRYKLADPLADDTDYLRILDVFTKYNIRYFFYIGGNDSMDTCSKISGFLAEHDYKCNVIGIPKTIDNDLPITDHCPGFGSAAKYVANICMEVCMDTRVYDIGSMTVIEIMGRDAGWLTAASALAKARGLGPDLIYVPEVPFNMIDFLSDVTRVYEKNGDVMVTVSEGIKDKNGTYIASYFTDNTNEKDASGHPKMGGLATSLANFAKSKINAKVRGIELSLLQRCAVHLASETDIMEAYEVGKKAFEYAFDGISDKMIGLIRVSNSPYKSETCLIDLVDVANAVKRIPREWINEAGNDLRKDFLDYTYPLIQGDVQMPYKDGLPRFARLKRILTREM
mgnify:CR=1 FL=1